MISTRFALASIALATVAAATPVAAQEIGLPVGAKAPAAQVSTLDGKAVDLSQYIGTGPVVLEFWATWCSNCKELEPTLLKLVQQYEGKVHFIDVAVGVNQTPARVKAYAEKYHYTHTMLYDTDGNAVTAYNVPATSYVLVLDRTGKIVYTGLGGDQDLAAAVKKAL